MHRSIILFFSVFSFSICIRIPFLGQKLEGFGHQEWLAGHTLVILKIWQKEGIQQHYYALPYTFYRTADKHIPFIPGVMDKRGNGYYISYPPFAFYLLYVIARILCFTPNELYLQIVTLLIQLVTGILLYILLKKWNFSDTTALLGASIYFLLPITLRYHTQAYFCDILAQIGIVSVLILYQNYFQKSTLKNAIGLGFTLFLVTFTEWIGVFLTFIIILHHFWTKKTFKNIIHYTVWLFFMGLSIFLTIWIYSHIAGWNALKQAWIHKVHQRAVSDTVAYFSRTDIHTYYTIMRYYAVHYYPAVLAMSILLILNLRVIKDWLKIFSIPAFIVIFLAIILHHFIFLNFTAENDFAVLKTTIPLIIVWASGVQYSNFPKTSLYISYSILFVSSLYITLQGVQKEKRKDIQKFASELVRLSPENEMLVLHSSSSISPQVMYYSERNVYMNISTEDIKTHLKKYNLKKAIILYTDWQYHTERTEIIFSK